RDVELRVLAEQAHHLVAVRAERLAQVTDLIREGDLHAVKRVTSVLEHLGNTDVGDVHGSLDTGVELRHFPASRFMLRADDCEWRVRKITKRRALTQELRTHAHADVAARPLS